MEGRQFPSGDIQLPPNYIEENRIRLLLMESADSDVKI